MQEKVEADSCEIIEVGNSIFDQNSEIKLKVSTAMQLNKMLRKEGMMFREQEEIKQSQQMKQTKKGKRDRNAFDKQVAEPLDPDGENYFKYMAKYHPFSLEPSIQGVIPSEPIQIEEKQIASKAAG